MKNYKIGYTTGVYDLFHIGHLNIIKKAKEQCDYLIVGVTTDQEVVRVKNKKPVIPFEERFEIVKSIRYVDCVVPEHNTDKVLAWELLKFDALFKGDDWKGTPKWDEYEQKFSKLGVDIVYFPYTKHISSSYLRAILEKIIYLK